MSLIWNYLSTIKHYLYVHWNTTTIFKEIVKNLFNFCIRNSFSQKKILETKDLIVTEK